MNQRYIFTKSDDVIPTLFKQSIQGGYSLSLRQPYKMKLN